MKTRFIYGTKPNVVRTYFIYADSAKSQKLIIEKQKELETLQQALKDKLKDRPKDTEVIHSYLNKLKETSVIWEYPIIKQLKETDSLSHIVATLKEAYNTESKKIAELEKKRQVSNREKKPLGTLHYYLQHFEAFKGDSNKLFAGYEKKVNELKEGIKNAEKELAYLKQHAKEIDSADQKAQEAHNNLMAKRNRHLEVSKRYNEMTGDDDKAIKLWAKKHELYNNNGAEDSMLKSIVANNRAEHIGGYEGYSQSNSAYWAKENHSKPLSTWGKNDIKTLENLLGHKVSLSKLKNTLKDYGEDGWHHTSKYYNKTNFYSLPKAIHELGLGNFAESIKK